MGLDFSKIVGEQIKAAQEAALAAREAAAKTGTGFLRTSPNPLKKPAFAFPSRYTVLSSKLPQVHLTRTCYSEFSRYPKQIEEIRARMLAKRDGALRVLDIGVAQGQEPLTHIETAFELSKGSAKSISNFLDLKTADVLMFAPELPAEAAGLDSAIIKHLENIYDPRSGKSIWGKPIEDVIGSLLQRGEKQDVILFNNVIQHMEPKSEQALQTTCEQIADLVAPNGILCAAIEKERLTEPSVIRRMEILHKILKEKNFVEIGDGIFQKA